MCVCVVPVVHVYMYIPVLLQLQLSIQTFVDAVMCLSCQEPASLGHTNILREREGRERGEREREREGGGEREGGLTTYVLLILFLH